MLINANGKFKIAVSWAQISGELALRLKYMANRAAKNMTSLPSQTIVPTEVGLGRWIWLWAAEAELMSKFYMFKSL
ncbi:MAG: hypothetical protein RL523_143 [Actinomycetota bacterium]